MTEEWSGLYCCEVHYHLAHGRGTWDVNCKESTALSAHCLSGLVAEGSHR